MKPRLTSLLGLMLVLSGSEARVQGAEVNGGTYFIQLVRGTVDDTPPAPGARPIGPKVARCFQPVFKWSHYWEMSRREIVLPAGRVTRIQLNPERAVEFDLTEPGKRKVKTFEGAKPVCSVVNAAGDRMSIVGGERAANSSWFIVVRRDQPTK
jgi:hypothetical protein